MYRLMANEALYSSYKDTIENRKIDTCVLDSEPREALMFNQALRLRFTFTGPPSTIN